MVKVKVIGKAPQYTTQGAAGFDLAAAYPVFIPAGMSALVRTGLRVAIPEGYEMQIRPRSGLALKYNVSVLNSPGTIDSDYRGEVGVILINHDGYNNYEVKVGDRIAQGVISKVDKAEFIVVEDLDETERNTNGFGSTGV